MRFQCPMCKGIVSVENSDMGSSVQCGHCNKPVTVPSSRTASGSVIGDFIILHELGRGGMGVVYLAHQISLDRPAALKILAENYANNADFVVGFIKEARAAAKLNHPNIVQAYAVGDDDGIFYFAMEHVDGETMKNILMRENKLSVDRAIDITRQIAEALDYAWQEEKLVHRDIKPDNIMLTSSGRAKLADLGLAKVGNENSQAEGDEVMGTPQYISPEQLTGDKLDNRTDIYCLGATFYHFLTGRFPYEGASAIEIARQHLDGTLVPPNQVDPAIPEAVSKVVEKMMAKDPAKRYQSAGKLAEDLAQIKRGQNPFGVPRIQAPGGQKGAAPKLNIPGKNLKNTGKKPTLSVKPKDSAPSGTNVPNETASNSVKKSASPASPAETASQPAGSPSVKKKKKVQSGGRSVVKIIVGIVVVLILAAGGAFGYFRFVKKQDPVAIISQAKAVIRQKTAVPEPSEFMKAAAPVVKQLHQENSDAAANAKLCYDFLKKRISPETDEEKRLQDEIIAYFVRQDEETVDNARIKAHKKYDEEQERKRIAKEAAAEAKIKKDHEAKIRAAEKEKAEKERQRIAREQRALQAKKQNFKRQIEYRERQMFLDIVRCGEKHDAESLKKIFEENINIRNNIPRPEYISQVEFENYTKLFIGRARFLRRMMENAWKWDKIFTDGDSRLIGMQIELNSDICKLTGIKDGEVSGKIGSKEISVPVAKLVNTRKFCRFAVKAAEELKQKDTLPFFFFWRGAYKMAYEAALEASPRGRNSYSYVVTSYLKAAMKDPRIKPQLEKKFRGVPEYDRLNPVRRPPPRRPAARKQSPKKTPAKRPVKKK